MNPEFKDELVVPSEIKQVNYFRKREAGVGRMIDYIRLVLPNDETVFLHDVVSKNQLVTRAGEKISELRAIRDYEVRNQILSDALKKRGEPLIFRLTKSNGFWHCYAVVTKKFVEVTHVELYRMVEQELQTRGLTWVDTSEFRTSKRVWKTYIFEKQVGQKVGDTVQCGIRIANSCKATSSIIFYPFWMRLACTNGMTSSKGVWKPATVHKGNKLDILGSVKQTLEEALNQAFGFERLIVEARKVTIERDQMNLLVREISVKKGFAEYVQRYIGYRVEKEDKTLWGLVNAMTYVSSHEVKPEMSKLKIEQTAHSLLRGGEKMVRELLAPKPSSSTFQPDEQTACEECGSTDCKGALGYDCQYKDVEK